MDERQLIEQRIFRFQAYGQTLPGAEVYFREDWQTIYFSLLGKQFGMMTPLADQESKITLKNTPEYNEELRELYPEIIVPGYYANKKHWNSIRLHSKIVTDDMIENLIKQSYLLVKQKLTKKEQTTIRGEAE